MMEDVSVQNPKETASFLSLLTFSWLNNVLKLGSKQPLEEKHLLPLETSFQAEKLVADLHWKGNGWLKKEHPNKQNKSSSLEGHDESYFSQRLHRFSTPEGF